MSMLSCLKGRVCLLQGLLLLGFVGCSSVFQGGESNQSEIPISNAQSAEKVIELALENAGIPRGHGTIVSYKVDGDSKEDSLLGMIAPEFLLKHGYRVVENNDSTCRTLIYQTLDEIQFGLDTLYVNLYIERTKKKSKLIRCVASQRVRRHSEAHIGTVFLYPVPIPVPDLVGEIGDDRGSGFKKVYKGRGVKEDTFPFHLLPSIENGESFTTIFPEQDPRLVRGIKKNVQPFLLGITMTALVWLLYSYRG